MTCQNCRREIPEGQLGCAPCLVDRSRIETRKLVLESAMMADFYGFRETLHVFDKEGRELHSTPGKRVAWCGAKPRDPKAVTFAARTMLNRMTGVCKECLGSANHV